MRGSVLVVVLASCGSTPQTAPPPQTPEPPLEPVARRYPERAPPLALASVAPGTTFRRRDELPDACEHALSWLTLDEVGLLGLRAFASADGSSCAKRAAVAACAVERAATRSEIGSRLIAIRECYVEFPDDQVDARAWLVLLHTRWDGSIDTSTWLRYAHYADAAMALEGGEDHAVAALENAARVGPGDPRIAPAAARIAASPHHDPLFTARLVALGYAPPP